MIAAHPFGDPQTLEVAGDASDPTVVHLTWRAGAADDLTLLGIHLDVLPEDRVMLDGAITYEDGDGATVAAAPELGDYLLDHLEVTAAGERCTGVLPDGRDAAADPLDDGVEVAFTCPAPVDAVTITATTLTDLHPAYRTLATGPDGQHRVYESGADTHEWSVPAAAGPSGPSGTTSATGATGTTGPGAGDGGLSLGASAALQMCGVLGAVLLVVAGGTLAVRRRRGRLPSTTPPPRRSTS